MEDDEELKRIREMKLRQMMEKMRETGRRGKIALNKPIVVTDATFNEVISGHPLVVIDCWAPWCGPCQMVAPILEELARDYAGKIIFGKLNVDENPITAMQFQVMSIPTLLVFKYGKLVDRIVGAMPRQKLELQITRYL
ncbi:MAG: thioredoxin [Candidatus Bathyarchaeia archaeon]